MQPTSPLDSTPKAGAGASFFLGILAFCLVGVLIVAMRAGLTAGQTYDDKRAELRASRLTALRRAERQSLTTYAWVDKAKGAVRIPIERAMELTRSELPRVAVPSAVKAEANTTNIVPPYTQSAPPAASPSPSPMSPTPAKQ